jgi:hypothetical protein
MNNRWTVILALVFLGVAIGVERLSAAHLGRMNGRKAVLNERLSEAEARAHHVARERTQYQALNGLTRGPSGRRTAPTCCAGSPTPRRRPVSG